jgi:DNA-binding NarL/FixJ family response regulator
MADVADVSEAESDEMSVASTGIVQGGGAETTFRVLLAERRASAHSELSRRLERSGHEVLARVTSGQGALDYAALLRPDVVLIAPVLEDGPGVIAAATVTRELPGIAAVVLTTHPSALDPAARPNWGAVVVVHADAESEALDAELRRAVAQALALAASEIESEHAQSASGPADIAPTKSPTPQYVTPVPALAARVMEPELIEVPQPRPAKQPVAASPVAPQPVHTRPATPAAGASQRPALSFTDEDLLAIGPFVDAAEPALPTPARMSTPSSTAPQPAPSVAAAPTFMSDSDVVAEAAECLLERTGLSRSDAMRLMEQEAADTGQRLVDVARAVIGNGDAAAEAA